MGYIYGNIKTHKIGNPIRPIISQISTPAYDIAKYLNEIITPYIPNRYNLASSSDFINILRTTEAKGIMKSLDVESLFTNIPVDTTINLILDRIFKDDDYNTEIKMSKKHLKALLEICTKESPFLGPKQEMCIPKLMESRWDRH